MDNGRGWDWNKRQIIFDWINYKIYWKYRKIACCSVLVHHSKFRRGVLCQLHSVWIDLFLFGFFSKKSIKIWFDVAYNVLTLKVFNLSCWNTLIFIISYTIRLYANIEILCRIFHGFICYGISIKFPCNLLRYISKNFINTIWRKLCSHIMCKRLLSIWLYTYRVA